MQLISIKDVVEDDDPDVDYEIYEYLTKTKIKMI